MASTETKKYFNRSVCSCFPAEDEKTLAGEMPGFRKGVPNIFTATKKRWKDWQADKKQPACTEGAVWDTISRMIHDDLMRNREVRVNDPNELKNFRQKN